MAQVISLKIFLFLKRLLTALQIFTVIKDFIISVKFKPQLCTVYKKYWRKNAIN